MCVYGCCVESVSAKVCLKKIKHSAFLFVDLLECFGWRCALSENVRSERLAGAKGGAGACHLCESGRERWVGRAERALVGVRERWHGQARAGTQIYLRGGLAVAVFPHPYMVAVALLLGKGLALLLQAKLLWGNFKGFSYSFLA